MRSKSIREHLERLPEDERDFAELKLHMLSRLWTWEFVPETCEQVQREMEVEHGVDRLFRALNCHKDIFTSDSCGGHVYNKRDRAFCTGRRKFADGHCATPGYVSGYIRCGEGTDEEFIELLDKATRDLKHITFSAGRCRPGEKWTTFRIEGRYLPAERKRMNAVDWAREMWSEFDTLAQRVEEWVKSTGEIDECFCVEPVSRLEELLKRAEEVVKGLRRGWV